MQKITFFDMENHSDGVVCDCPLSRVDFCNPRAFSLGADYSRRCTPERILFRFAAHFSTNEFRLKGSEYGHFLKLDKCVKLKPFTACGAYKYI